MRVRRRDLTALRFAVFCLPLLFSWLASAQGINTTGASNCTEADFDTNLKFVNGPGDYYQLVVEKKNISGHPCLFDGPTYGPSFVPHRVPGHDPVALCYFCEDRTPDGRVPMVAPVSANPDQVVRQTFRWKTTSANGEPCLVAQWMSGPILLVAPSLLRPICSQVEVSRFSIEEQAAAQADSALHDQPEFELTASKSQYNIGESFSLRVRRASTGHPAALNDYDCPTLYVRERSPDGGTRIDEDQPYAFKGCGKPVLGYREGDWKSGFDLPSGVNSKWSGVGEHLLMVSRLVGSSDDPPVHFAYSNQLRIRQIDPAPIPRQWGARVKGLAADITLDKDTYRLGDDIPLHLAIADFDAPVPVYSWDSVWDPCMVVGIQVQDSAGRVLGNDQRFPSWTICTGHGFGPRPLTKGKVVPLEKSLGAEGWLPNQPGTYTVTVSWSPCFSPKPNSSPSGLTGEFETYADVHASATIHILGSQASR